VATVSQSHPRIVSQTELTAADLPAQLSVNLGELVGTAREGLLALCVGIGLSVVQELFQEEVIRLAGPKGKHDPERAAYRHGQEPRQLTLGGRRVQVEKPRVRSLEDEELELRSYQAFSARDALTEAAVGRMLARLSTRRYGAGLEPVGESVGSLATSKSAISRRFVEGSERRLGELFGRDLSELEILVVFIDGIVIGDHCVVVSLGVDAKGNKHPLGLWKGSTENKTVCQALLSNLIERGLPADRALLFVIDGSKAIRAAIRHTFGELALVQRCREHKKRNVVDQLPEVMRSGVRGKLKRAWEAADVRHGETLLHALAKELEAEHPGAAASLREGLEETLTVSRLALPPTLLHTVKTTNAIESMISVAQDVMGNVKRWRNGQMVMRWTAAGMLEAEKQFHRVDGYRELPVLRVALAAHQERVAPQTATSSVA
jgi:transposase-like protein